VFPPAYFGGFSDTVLVRNKAQFEGNGHSLAKNFNAVAEQHSAARRVRLSAPHCH